MFKKPLYTHSIVEEAANNGSITKRSKLKTFATKQVAQNDHEDERLTWELLASHELRKCE